MTPKQQRALGAAAQRDRAKLRASFKAQREEFNRTRQAPAPRPKPRPKPKGKARAKAGTMSLSYNGFSPAPMPLAFSVGRATRLQGLARKEITTTAGTLAGQDYTLVFFNGHAGHYVGFAYGINSTANTFVHAAHWSMDAAGFDSSKSPTGTSGQPDTAMCSKMSVRIRNISKAIDVAGVVRVLNVAAGITVIGANNQESGVDLVNLVNYVNDHPRTRTFGAAEMRASRQFDTHPVDQSKYHSFAPPSTTFGEWLHALEDPAQSTLVMLLPTILANHYEITVNAHYYARYRVTGPLANMAAHPPTAPLSAINRARDETERNGSDGFMVEARRAGGRILRAAETPFGEALGAAAGAML